MNINSQGGSGFLSKYCNFQPRKSDLMGLLMEFYGNTTCDYFNVPELLRLPVPSSPCSSVGDAVKGVILQVVILWSTDVLYLKNKQLLFLDDNLCLEFII